MIEQEVREALSPLGKLAWDAYAASAGDTVVVDTRYYSNLVVFTDVSAAADITLDAVSQDNVNFRTVGETVHSYAGAGSAINDLNSVITTKEALKYRYLRFKVSAAVTITLEVAGKHTGNSTILSEDEAGLFKTADFTEIRDITRVAGTAQTAADWTPLLQKLDVLLSSRAADASFLTVSSSNTWTDPASNPELSLDCDGRNTVEFWVSEPTGGVTVNIYGSKDNTNWRQTTSYTTNAGGNATDVLSIGFRYVKIEIVNTAVGSYTAELSASR